MSDKENPCDIVGTGRCSIISDLYRLQDKYCRLENEKIEIERELKDLRKTIADNTIPYSDNYINYIAGVVGDIKTACKWTIQASVMLCICMSLLCAIAYARSDSLDLKVYSMIAMLVGILVISTLGYITIPSKRVFYSMVKDYIEHKKAEKVAEFYQLFPLPKEVGANNEANQKNG